MATRLIGTDTANPRLPVDVIEATQGATAADLAPGDVIVAANDYSDAAAAGAQANAFGYTDEALATAKTYTDDQIAQAVIDPALVAFADVPETITGTQPNIAVSPAGLAGWDRVIDVRRFGAKGDGVADDTAAIQAALDLIPFSFGTPPITIELAPGVYKITNTLDISRSSVTLRGFGVGPPADWTPNPGKGTTIRWAGPAGIPMLRLFDTRYCKLHDIYFQGNATNPPSEGLLMENIAGGGQGTNEQTLVERCWFGWMRSDIADYQMTYCVRIGGINADNDQYRFRDCRFDSATNTQVKIDNPMHCWGLFDNCFFQGAPGTAPAAKGFESAAECVLVNPQFNRCTVDVTVTQPVQVTTLGWCSEWSRKLADLGSGAKLIIKGATLGLRDISGGYYIDAPLAVNGGGVDLDGCQLVGINAGGRPRLRLIASGATYPGYLMIRNSDVLNSDLEVSGTNVASKLHVDIATHDGSIDKTFLTGVFTYTPPAIGRFGVPVGGATGQVLTKVDSSNYNTQWATPSGGGGGGSPLVSYDAIPVVGRWVHPSGTSVSVAMGINNAGFIAVSVPPCTITDVEFEVVTAVAGNGRIALYTSKTDRHHPDSLLAESPTVSVGTTGNKTITLTTPVVFAGGVLWLALDIDVAGVSVRGASGQQTPWFISPSATAVAVAYQNLTWPHAAAAAFPATLSDLTGPGVGQPKVGFKVSAVTLS